MTHVQPYVGQPCWATVPAPGGLVELVALVGLSSRAPDDLQGMWAQVRFLGGTCVATVGSRAWVPVRDLQPCWWPEAGELP